MALLNIGLILENRKQILGRNERYLEYIRPYNKKKSIKIVDDKIQTKKILRKNNIPAPKLIAVIKDKNHLSEFDFSTLPNSFVFKPVHGVRGGGVEIVYNKNKEGKWIKSDGKKATDEDLRSSMGDIIDGKYSLFNEPDKVMIEERVRPHKNFKDYTYKGTPDIRIIVFNKIPIMSYIRIPTRQSDGKANLDLGAIGAGIDMAVGKTTQAIAGKSGYIEYVPDSNLPLSGIKIPFWNRMLRYAIEASQITGLGFAAIDFLIDRDLGPLIVEMNARPGLSIQLANGDGLRWRLKKAKGLKVKTVDQGIRLAKDLFGGEIEEEIEAVSGKKVIGLIEEVTLYSVDKKKSIKVKAKIDTGADSTSIDTELAKQLGYGEIIDKIKAENIPDKMELEQAREVMHELADKYKDTYHYLNDIDLIKSSHGLSIRPSINMNIAIDEFNFETKCNIFDRSSLEYKMIVGRRSLGNFLIDTSKT